MASAAAVLAAAAGAAGAGTAAASTAARPAGPASGLASYVTPVKWATCAHGIPARFRCASVPAPLSYASPAGQRIRLAVMELPGTDPAADRTGSLFVNFGGPGGPDITDLVNRWDTVFSAAIRAKFNLVTWDPRGIEYSDPVNCFPSYAASQDFYNDDPVFPYPAAGNAAYFALNAQLGQDCEQRAARLLPHVSTTDTARDLHLIREDIGARRLNYLGYSYGTVIGATYANLFPANVRSMVLDGTVDFRGNADGDTAGIARKEPIDVRNGVDQAGEEVFQRFLTLCARAGTSKCAFAAGGNLPGKWNTLLARARAGQLSFQYLMIYAYYDLEAPLTDWPALATQLQDYYASTSNGRSLTAAQEHGLARQASRAAAVNIDGPAAAALPAPAAATTSYTGNGSDAYYAIQCADSIVPSSDAAYTSAASAAGATYPGFGQLITYDAMPCATWPAMHTDAYDGPWNKSRTPILVINAVNDPITPIWGARAAVRELKNARLLRVSGEGHTSMYVEPSTCRDHAELAYLDTGKLPAAGTTCPVTRLPFGLTP
jgi:pimeloyl-ACP methyl ester carboxylesterase